MNTPPRPVKEDQQLASYIAMVVRNAMEDFHCQYLTDDQMKELNPIVRNAVCTALHAFNTTRRPTRRRDSWITTAAWFPSTGNSRNCWMDTCRCGIAREARQNQIVIESEVVRGWAGVRTTSTSPTASPTRQPRCRSCRRFISLRFTAFCRIFQIGDFATHHHRALDRVSAAPRYHIGNTPAGPHAAGLAASGNNSVSSNSAYATDAEMPSAISSPA